MEPIISGTTTERLVRAVAMAAIVNGFAVWFLWDGYAGYRRENVQALVDLLGAVPDEPPAIFEELTEVFARKLIAAIGEQGTSTDLEKRLGRPSLQQGDDLYYLGPSGYLKASLDDEKVTAMKWNAGRRSMADQIGQRYFGYALGALGLFAVVHLIRVGLTRVSLTDEGLKVGRRPPIPFKAITGLKRPEKARDEAVLVEYEIDGRRDFVALDNYSVKKQRAIIAAIRAELGLPAEGHDRNAASGADQRK